MTTNLKYSASIEQFLAHEMAPDERKAFEKELRINPDLVDELKLSKHIDSALEREDIIDLRQKLIAVINANRVAKTEVPVVRLHTRKWWYAAASLLLLCTVAATLYLQTPRSVSGDALFTEFYSSDNIVDQTRGDQNLVEAVLKFQQKDFTSSAILFKKIIDKDASNIAVKFYYGISNIEIRNYANAINAFNEIIWQNDNLYIEHAEWYLGLCYLKSNQNDKALDQFLAVASNPDNYHQKEARAILDKMQHK